MIKYNNNLTYEEVAERYSYNEFSGELCSKKTNQPIGTVVDGYIVVGIRKKQYRAHHLAWLLHYGRWPENELDHINGNKSDNRISNLREATRQQNLRNRRTYKNNQLGVKGVIQVGPNRFRAQLWHNGKFVLASEFKDLESAAAAYQQMSRDMFGEWHRTA